LKQAKAVDEHPVVWLGFEEDCILTTCKNGESRHFFAARTARYTKLRTFHMEFAIRLVFELRTGTPLNVARGPTRAFVELGRVVKLIRKWIADFFFSQATSELGTVRRKARPMMTAVNR
jgi:hypothetical protein